MKTSPSRPHWTTLESVTALPRIRAARPRGWLEAGGGQESSRLLCVCAGCLSLREKARLLVLPRLPASGPLPLTEVSMQPPPQEVARSHHSGIKKGSEREMSNARESSLSLHGRHCWNAVCHCVVEMKRSVCVCVCVMCSCLCFSHLSFSSYQCGKGL